jgi:hypothetical protein
VVQLQSSFIFACAKKSAIIFVYTAGGYLVGCPKDCRHPSFSIGPDKNFYFSALFDRTSMTCCVRSLIFDRLDN